MIRASITPGIARTRFNRSSESMVAPTILCRGSECRGAPVGAGLRVPHFPGRPPRSRGSGQDPDVIAVRLYPEELVPSSHRLPRGKAEHLAGRSPNVDLLAVFIPISRHYSLHCHCLLFRPKTTSLTAPQLHWYRARAHLDARRISLAG